MQIARGMAIAGSAPARRAASGRSPCATSRARIWAFVGVPFLVIGSLAFAALAGAEGQGRFPHCSGQLMFTRIGWSARGEQSHYVTTCL
jgi:hypothetical protein